jgi:hypothetical protein
LHDFKESKRKAINFTDSSLESGNNGRTGKTLLAKSIGKLRVYGEINGKDFNPTKTHKYQTLQMDTQIVNLNDITKGFQLEWIYNDITEGLSVEKKNQTPFRIAPNIVICSNRPLETKGGSDRDRILEFEFAHYFSEKYSPEDHFKHRFFEDWNESDWNAFDNFMLYCAKFFLEVGDMVQPHNTNLAKRKIIEYTNPEFIEFIESQDLKIGVEYDKKAFFEDFKRFAPDYDNPKFKMNTFTKWLTTYTENTADYGGISHYQNKKENKSVFCLKAPDYGVKQ